ncbi:hypothetical protein FBU59_001564 [Linderina macrospora]|uniref:Uncharacterized protein n=1 Tax=Linderina macrospora TaxID=4868 RepID=A0ACC1JDR5_9FUNG|nr:hypothetical protein FBU59_001564 [Linderina macrospora]
MSATNETTAPAATILIDEYPNKVFVGNLSFKTTDGQLQDYFAEVGEVKEARIITRGPRSLGYGFVAFGDEATVQKAVELRNHTEFGGRQINVEAARPMPESAIVARAQHVSGEPKPSGQRRARKPRARKEAARVDTVESSDAPTTEDAKESKEGNGEAKSRGAKRSGRRFGARRFPAKDKEEVKAEEAVPAKKAERKPREKKPVDEDRTPSETVVFVGNLPFSTTDEELAKLFGEFSIASAHVVVNKKSSRPKGFGFVTFANNAEQKKALTKLAGEPLTLSERVLTIKAALSETPAATEGESA